MKYTITFRNIEHTEALDENIRRKGKKLEKFFSEPAEMQWTCWVENHDQFAEIKLVHKGKNLVAKAHSLDLYKSMDMAVEKLTNQIAHQH